MENPFATIDDTSGLFDSHDFTNVKIGEKVGIGLVCMCNPIGL